MENNQLSVISFSLTTSCWSRHHFRTSSKMIEDLTNVQLNMDWRSMTNP